MGTKVKGIYKGVKYSLSQMFVVKEEAEMQIGCPTDVKHVSHIGWDGPSGSAPSWMNEFKTGSNFASSSIDNNGSKLSPWSSQDFRASMKQQPESEMCNDASPTEKQQRATNVPNNIKKKQRRKKIKPRTTSSPESNSPTSTSKPVRTAAKAKTNFAKGNAKPSIEVEVA